MQRSTGYHLIIAVMATANTFLRASHQLFRPHGVTEAQFNVLNILGPEPDGMSQRELSDLLVVDRSNTTGLLDRMEKSGWVRRKDHPADRRVYLVVLTAEGRKLWQKVLPDYLAAVAQVTGGLSEGEMKRTMETMKRLEDAARAWGETYES
ncbi:MAG TPA: MarR family transcriptional regulator [Candidatus Didemnitutus sp.]|nr:MarR family transcriptional regulator [Candidatus Didemnitutus sp.]